MQQTTTKIPKGYKQTELGVIPEDWAVKKLGDISEVATGNTPPTNDRTNYGEDYFFVSPADLGKDKWILNTEKKLSTKGYNVSRKFPKNSVLFTCIGSTIGKSGIAERDLTSNQQINAIFPNDNYSSDYLYYALSILSNKIKSLAGEQAVPLINKTQFCETPVAFPKLPEQTAIATVLSDTDALIERLEKLIAKKIAIKQGAMQQLLTGKKRLPGFSGEWEVKRLGEIGEITGAGIDKKIKSDEVPVKLVNYLDVFHKDFIYSKDLNHWVTAPIMQAQRCAVKKGDIFFTPSSEMRYDIAISAVAMEDIPDAGYSYHVDRLRLYNDWDLAFRTYIFKTKDFIDQAETICEGSGKRYVISLTKFREMIVKYPIDKTEQTAIATILSDMDAEIESLEQKRDKYIMLKQGMMQGLLTGKTRLV